MDGTGSPSRSPGYFSLFIPPLIIAPGLFQATTPSPTLKTSEADRICVQSLARKRRRKPSTQQLSKKLTACLFTRG